MCVFAREAANLARPQSNQLLLVKGSQFCIYELFESVGLPPIHLIETPGSRATDAYWIRGVLPQGVPLVLDTAEATRSPSRISAQRW